MSRRLAYHTRSDADISFHRGESRSIIGWLTARQQALHRCENCSRDLLYRRGYGAGTGTCSHREARYSDPGNVIFFPSSIEITLAETVIPTTPRLPRAYVAGELQLISSSPLPLSLRVCVCVCVCVYVYVCARAYVRTTLSRDCNFARERWVCDSSFSNIFVLYDTRMILYEAHSYKNCCLHYSFGWNVYLNCIRFLSDRKIILL